MKVAVITLPIRQPDEIRELIYPVDGNKSLEYDKPVRCPINAIFAKTLKKGDELKVIYIQVIGENSLGEENKKVFIDELEGINKNIGAILSYDTVEMEFLATKNTYNKLITDLSEKIPENSELYTDITYGSKPEILSLFCALRFVEEFRDAFLEFFVYGKVEFPKEKGDPVSPMIFDLTSLYYLFKLMGTMDKMDADTASGILKDFFAM